MAMSGSPLSFLFIGLLAGTHASAWGALKDSPYEGFSIEKFLRSVGVGLVAGWLLYQLVPSARAIHPAIVLATVVTLERATTEFYKAFVRNEDQSKYLIPSRFTFLGRRTSKRGRALAGTIVAIGFAAFLAIPLLIHPQASSLLQATIVGLYAGIGVACGGAWKDAPSEGFSIRKFLRSPLIAAVAAGALWEMQGQTFFLIMGAIGMERMATELYKSCFARCRPGKFLLSVIPEPSGLIRQIALLLPYGATWFVFAIQFGGRPLWIATALIFTIFMVPRVPAFRLIRVLTVGVDRQVNHVLKMIRNAGWLWPEPHRSQ